VWQETERSRSLSRETPGNMVSYNDKVGNLGPEEFDGYRFARLRELSGNQQKLQAVTTSPYQINFGHGPHACPGRFFAIYEIKVLLIHFLRNYEMRMPLVDGKPGPRPANLRPIGLGVGNVPPPTATIEIKARAASK
jgi:hypothetical protein